MLRNSKCTETSFSPISTDSLCLQHTQMPRFRDLVIFMPTMTTTTARTTTDIQTDYFKPCACVRGKYKYSGIFCFWWPLPMIRLVKVIKSIGAIFFVYLRIHVHNWFHVYSIAISLKQHYWDTWSSWRTLTSHWLTPWSHWWVKHNSLLGYRLLVFVMLATLTLFCPVNAVWVCYVDDPYLILSLCRWPLPYFVASFSLSLPTPLLSHSLFLGLLHHEAECYLWTCPCLYARVQQCPPIYP